ncbi:hypothetical protein KY342_06975 [Candidatus Woesearchaeota archaeon]|nr:hypothetical protein [Candidatus Woesearchaeota archaeon]
MKTKVKQRNNYGIIISLLFVLVIVAFGIIYGLNIQEQNLVTGSFVKTPNEVKMYIFPWIILLGFVVLLIYLNKGINPAPVKSKIRSLK